MNKVWVVDDNPAVAESLVAMLQTEGIDSRAILDGQTVVNDLEKGLLPAAVILDLSMPGINGNAVVSYIQANPRWIFPILVLTGWEEQLEKKVRGRVLKVLPKTIAPLDLTVVLRRAMGQRIQWNHIDD